MYRLECSIYAFLPHIRIFCSPDQIHNYLLPDSTAFKLSNAKYERCIRPKISAPLKYTFM